MALENTSGSQTAVIDTIHTLATITTAGTFILVVDLANLVNADIVELIIESRARTGDTDRQLYKSTYAFVQGDKLVHSVPVVSIHQVVFKLQQTDGTGRVFPWSIYEI